MTVITNAWQARQEIEYAIKAYEAGNATAEMMIARIRQVMSVFDN